MYVIGSSDVPLYLYRLGNEWALFEGGLTGMGPLVLEQLRTIVGDLSAIRYWFITHAHYDHYGLLPYLASHLDDIIIIASHEAVRSFNSKGARELSASLNAAVADEWQFDTDSERLTELFHKHITGTYKLNAIGHNERVDLGNGVSVTTIATPGHSRCSTSYLIEPDGILLCSDSLGELITEHEFLPLVFDNYAAYRASLNTLSLLSPALIGMGHHGILSGDLARAAANDARDCLDRFTAKFWKEETSVEHFHQLADSLSHQHWERARRFITKELHTKSMLRTYELLIDAKENSNG